MFSRRFVIALASTFLLAFAGTTAYTIAQAAPACQKCRKEGCPQGYCYFDCVSCCYNDPRLGTVCFK